MKKTFATTATALLMFVSFNSFAISPLKNADAKSVLKNYVEAVTLGSDMFNKYLFAEDFTYSNTANKDVHNKTAFLKFLKENKGFQYNANTQYEIVDLTGKSCIAKASMEFEHFTRVDHIHLQHSDKGWKVSKIVTTYP